MRDLLKLLEGFITEDEIEVPAAEMMKRYGGKPMPFKNLPDAAKASLKQYMVIDGENENYTNQIYGYLELPMEELIELLDNQFGNVDGERGVENWKTDKIQFRYNYPKTSIWPLIWGQYGMEDGSHRLHRYVMTGVKVVPIVLCLSDSF